MKKIIFWSLAAVILAALIVATTGKIAPLSWGIWGDINQDSGIGLGGYDVVSYHTEGTPTLGQEKISASWNGAEWYFSSTGNKTLFEANPERYAPTYGGFCAFAVFNNFTADVDPAIWHIEDDKLYFFASDGSRSRWVAEISEGAVQVSDRNWVQR